MSGRMRLMMRRVVAALAWAAWTAAANPAARPAQWERHWPAFRGPDGSGVARFADIPDSWSEDEGRGIAWKAPLSLPGLSSPVVWADRVVVTGASREEQHVTCYDLATGAVRWRSVRSPGAGVPTDYQVYQDYEERGAHAAPTPVVDGRHVFALFATGEVIAYDLADGSERWTFFDDPPEGNWYGLSSSPVRFQDMLIVLLDGRRGRMVALDAATGVKRWSADRDDQTWSTPLLLTPREGPPQLVIAGSPLLSGWDPLRGERLWHADLFGADQAVSPIQAGDLAVVAFGGAFAMRVDGRGNVGSSHLAWEQLDLDLGAFPEVASPVFDGERIYFHEHDVLVCLDAATGEVLYEAELPFETGYASISLVGDRLLLFARDSGRTAWVRSGPRFELLGDSLIGEPVAVPPAFAPGRILMRGSGHLYAIGDGTPAS